MKSIKKILVTLTAGLFMFGVIGCNPIVTPSDGGGTESPANPENPGTPETPGGENPESPVQNNNPDPRGSREANLQFIFNNQTLGTTTLTVRRSEWNQLLKNYDYFYKNENCVRGIEYKYEKDGVTWKIDNIGFRLRGNTSRFRPQGKDFPKDNSGNVKMNESWSQEYYTYAATCPDTDYRQSHFKVDFEEFLEGDAEMKMAGCMKGVALKRMDSTCTREIMCYDLFHKFGIWTAPYASHTRVLFKFVEDVDEQGNIISDTTNCTVTDVDFGVYEMFEEVNKQSLKAREDGNNSASNPWKNNKGNLWKVSGGDLSNPNATMDVEENLIEFNEDGTFKSYIWNQPTYDLKTNKESPDKESAITELQGFITELKNLPSSNTNANDEKAIKDFYEKWFDIDFFLKSYAVNILVGMDDDYWGNANNYYLYFGKDKNKNTKVYFIPFDYDNTLGASIKGDAGQPEGFKQNPLEWGRGQNRPLMDKLLLVPEYKQKFTDYLLEVSAETSAWNFTDCSALFLKWKAMVEPYLNSTDLEGHVATKSWGDYTWKPSGYSLTTESNNIYDATRDSFEKWLKKIDSITFDLNGGTINSSSADVTVSQPENGKALGGLVGGIPEKNGYILTGWTKTKDAEDYVNYATCTKVYARWKTKSEITDLFIYPIKDDNYSGIKIGILNVPSAAFVRNIYVNGKKVSRDAAYGTSDIVTASEWGYPFTKSGNSYTVKIEFNNDSWGSFSGNTTNEITIKAEDGMGDLYYKANGYKYTMSGNKLKFNPVPELSLSGLDSYGKYEVELNTTSWAWQGSKQITTLQDEIDFTEYLNGENPATSGTNMRFGIRFAGSDPSNTGYGTYWCILYDFGEDAGFVLQ